MKNSARTIGIALLAAAAGAACFPYQSERLPSRFNGHHACSPAIILDS